MTHESWIPSDSTGDVLRRLLDDGADLSKMHEIDFHLSMPSESACRSIVREVSTKGGRIRFAADGDGVRWTLWCTIRMIPDHASITEAERDLDIIAKKCGGWLDGWGAFPVL